MIGNDSTVFIIDDDEALCSSLCWLLQSVGLNVETYNSAQNYLLAHDPKRHGCLLIDVRMPQISGLQMQEKLKDLHNPLPVIVMTGHGDIPIAVRAMKAGAVDFITKPFNDQMLLELIQKTIAWDKACREFPIVDRGVMTKERLATLTPREHEVLKKIIAGKLNKQIAVELAIAISTVEVHRANVMKKMQTKTFATLIKICVEAGIE